MERERERERESLCLCLCMHDLLTAVVHQAGFVATHKSQSLEYKLYLSMLYPLMFAMICCNVYDQDCNVSYEHYCCYSLAAVHRVDCLLSVVVVVAFSVPVIMPLSRPARNLCKTLLLNYYNYGRGL